MYIHIYTHNSLLRLTRPFVYISIGRAQVVGRGLAEDGGTALLHRIRTYVKGWSSRVHRGYIYIYIYI